MSSDRNDLQPQPSSPDRFGEELEANSQPAAVANADPTDNEKSREDADDSSTDGDHSEPNASLTPMPTVEELPISELVAQLLRSPLLTWRRLSAAIKASSADTRLVTSVELATIQPIAGAKFHLTPRASIHDLLRKLLHRETARMAAYAIAVVFALIGSGFARGTADLSRTDEYSLRFAAPYLWLGFLLWLAGDIVGHLPQIRDYWNGCDRLARLRWIARIVPAIIMLSSLFLLAQSMAAPSELAVGIALNALARLASGFILALIIEIAGRRTQKGLISSSVSDFSNRVSESERQAIESRQPLRRAFLREISHLRKLIFLLASLCSLVVWANTSGNRIEPPTVQLWLLSAVLWGFVFSPLRWNLIDWATDTIDKVRRLTWKGHRWTIVAFIMIMILGASFRFDRLDTVPPEMFGDLIEKIQDAYKIRYQQDYRIFLSNNGGREPVHFYLLAILASQPGLEFNHYSLKLLTALESFATLPLIFWLSIEVIGERRRKFGLAVGLLAMGMVAVSFWHVVIGRQGLRIPLLSLFTALTSIYYVRALRYNRRSDFVKAGLALGFGLMSYQAVRMLPAALVAGVAIALIVKRFSWRTRAAYTLNLAVLAFVSLMVFLPLFHFWTEYPDDYLRRTTTRMFGDEPTSPEERLQILGEKAPVLLSNLRNAFLGFHYTYESSPISAVPGEPAMDTTTAAFMLLGVAAWLSMMVKMRDPVIWFIPVLLFFTLLTSALALSFPIEVPSFLRSSGAIAPAYLIAALPVVIICRLLWSSLPKPLGPALAVVFSAGVLLSAYHYNTSLYFGEFTDRFESSSHPQSQAGQIVRGFAESDGNYGNAFIISYPHWWDSRAVGIEAGKMFWDSGGSLEQIPHFMSRGLDRQGDFRLDPERDLLFFFPNHAAEALAQLEAWFPAGRELAIQTKLPTKSFFTYRVPALGEAGMKKFLEDNT